MKLLYLTHNALYCHFHCSLISFIIRLVAHWIRKAKRKFRRHIKKKDCPESQIDLGVLRESRTQDALLVERETRRGNQLTCPQLLALSGALGALPQVSFSSGNKYMCFFICNEIDTYST